MPSAKHLRLYPKPPSRKPRTPDESDKPVPAYAIEGGPINDRSGKATERMRKQGYRIPAE